MALPPTLHVNDNFNAEEAAHVAAEYVSSLDNLSAEVTFLLEEIKGKDKRISALIARMNSRHYGLSKSRKDDSISNASFPLPLQPGQPLPTEHMSQKDGMALQKLQLEWIKVIAEQEEKVKLAERLERIVNRARERGRSEWRKVGGIDIEDLEVDQKGLFDVGVEVMLPPGGLGSGSDGRPQKKRKPNALPLPLPSTNYSQTILHPPAGIPATSLHRQNPQSSSARSHPPPYSGHHPSSAREREHGGHGYGSRRADRERERGGGHGHVKDEDEDEEELLEGADGDADETIYCFCQQKSYGEMIACDNPDCEYQWFHLKCVDLEPPLPDNFYCSSCVAKMGQATHYGQKEKKNKKQRQ